MQSHLQGDAEYVAENFIENHGFNYLRSIHLLMRKYNCY